MRSLSARGTRLLQIGAVAGVVGAHVAAGVFLSTHDPYETQVFAPCPVLQLTGWQCPACGSTRALYSLLHGDAVQAFSMNPLVIAMYVATTLMLASVTDAARSKPRLGNGLAFSALALVVAAGLYTGIARNLLNA